MGHSGRRESLECRNELCQPLGMTSIIGAQPTEVPAAHGVDPSIDGSRRPAGAVVQLDQANLFGIPLNIAARNLATIATPVSGNPERRISQLISRASILLIGCLSNCPPNYLPRK